jgi:hypothetical protein
MNLQGKNEQNESSASHQAAAERGNCNACLQAQCSIHQSRLFHACLRLFALLIGLESTHLRANTANPRPEASLLSSTRKVSQRPGPRGTSTSGRGSPSVGPAGCRRSSRLSLTLVHQNRFGSVGGVNVVGWSWWACLDMLCTREVRLVGPLRTPCRLRLAGPHPRRGGFLRVFAVSVKSHTSPPCCQSCQSCQSCRAEKHHNL